MPESAQNTFNVGFGQQSYDMGSVAAGDYSDYFNSVKQSYGPWFWKYGDAMKEAITNATSFEYNKQEAQKNRDWQEYMSNTSYQRAMADLEAAGVNPYYLFNSGSGSGAPAQSGAAANGSGSSANSSSSAANLVSSLIGAAAKILVAIAAG